MNSTICAQNSVNMLLLVLAVLTASSSLCANAQGVGRDCGNGVTCFPCLSSSYMATTATAIANISSPQCGAGHNSPNACIHEKKDILKRLTNVGSAADCCGRCGSTDGCVSYTFFDGTNCNLFSKQPSSTVFGTNCVSGGVPPPPPPPAPPAPPGPPCKDCPNIVLMFTDGE